MDIGLDHLPYIHTLFVHFDITNPLFCIKDKICLVNSIKCINGKIDKNERKQGMMRNACHRKKNTYIVLVIYKLQIVGLWICCKSQIMHTRVICDKNLVKG
jgi:hypothetical protein